MQTRLSVVTGEERKMLGALCSGHGGFELLHRTSAAASGIAVLTIRHGRKSGGDIGDDGRGSSAWGGAADTLLSLRRPEGRTRPTLRNIECVSRFDGMPAEAIYEYVDGQYEFCGTD